MCVVHNGIIEIYAELNEELISSGALFKSETDTEVISQLINMKLKSYNDEMTAFKEALKEHKGALALGVLFEVKDNAIFLAKKGSPLVLVLLKIKFTSEVT